MRIERRRRRRIDGEDTGIEHFGRQSANSVNSTQYQNSDRGARPENVT